MLAPGHDDTIPQAPRESLAEAALQRNHSRARKARLLIAAVHQFCDIKRPTGEDTEIFRELFYQLIDGCGKSDRRAISAALARTPYCPRPILIYLALESPDIAAPVLLFSQALNETDIVTLANRFPKEHLKILCRRLTLTEPGARAIARYGGAECAELLARNCALLQPATPPAREPVAEHVPVSNAATEPSGTFRPHRDSELREQVVRLAGFGNRNRTAAPGKTGDSRPLASRLTQAARQGGTEMLARTVEEHCQIPAKKTAAILSNGSVENLAVLFRGLGVGNAAALQLILLISGMAIRDRAEYDTVKATIARLPIERCREFLEQELGARFDAQGVASKPAAAPLRFGEAISQRRQAISESGGSVARLPESQIRDVG
jgi:hypothetical protein